MEGSHYEIVEVVGGQCEIRKVLPLGGVKYPGNLILGRKIVPGGYKLGMILCQPGQKQEVEVGGIKFQIGGERAVVYHRDSKGITITFFDPF